MLSSSDTVIKTFKLPSEVLAMLESAKSVEIPKSREELLELSLGGSGNTKYEVRFDVPGKGDVLEATVLKCKNGVAVNYPEAYMRRRDPDCMLIADEDPSDKERFVDRFGKSFTGLRQEVIDWLQEQDLILLPFIAGGETVDTVGYDALMIAPKNSSFFATGLADLQGMIKLGDLPEDFKPRAIIYLAPPFRHTHCDGKQIVVHNRQEDLHEVFSLNLYPGPSAKKGVYGILLTIGEDEGWITAHGSTVQVVTPYDNVVTIMHEGASGSGKSEMLEHPHREHDGRLILGENIVSGKMRYLTLTQNCDLHPVTDDMALCHPSIQKNAKRLVVSDAESAWFLRVNHITKYGTDPNYERLCIHPPEPILFLNMQAQENSTCLIWEHIEDEPGKRCPNPRVILPRRMVPNIVNHPVRVDIRSFGLRTPPTTKENPNYGILGIMHVLPASLAWVWRMVSPRGFSNPSITDSKGMSSEGVGSYWPFATGRKVDQANLILRQIWNTPSTGYVLIPNQHVGAWKVSFMPQWIARDYLARRGGVRFRQDQLLNSRCPILGYSLNSILFEGAQIGNWFLQVHTQEEVGIEGYDAGAKMLTDFFKQELKPYLDEKDLDPIGREIIQCVLDDGDVEDYNKINPIKVEAIE